MALSKINTNQIVDGAVATADIADGLITTAKLADNAVTTAKTTDANITTAKLADNAVTTAKVTDGNITTAKVADDAVTQAKIGADAVGTTELANDVDVNTSGTVTATGATIRNSSSTGPALSIGTSSTSVADDGLIGGINFTSGSSNTINGRLFCKQYDTSENSAYFAHELRAPNGNALAEINREYMSQNAHGGVQVRRPNPANIFYYREAWKSVNVSAGQTTNLFKINQNDYYMSVSCIVEIMMLDTNYPTGSAMRVYGLLASTHQGRSTVQTKYTSMHDMGSYQNNVNEIGSDNFYFNTDITTSKSAGSNNGIVQIRVTTGMLLQASCTIRLHGMFLNARFEDQPITANL